MQINWALVSCFIIVFFAISGFSRGWWKEAVTTIILTILVFFLQNPDLAERFINIINGIIAAVWVVIPRSLIVGINDFMQTLTGSGFGSTPIQFDPTASGTWLTILLIVVAGAILLGRASLGLHPAPLGKLMGVIVGALNGFLVLSLAREYMDGRALPGQAAPPAEITIVSSNSFGPAASSLSLQFTNLPGYTILDSVIPWVLFGGGLLILFAVFKTRVGIASSADGKKIQTKPPPFYKRPPKPTQRPPRAFVEVQAE